jgi:hypothetical protein
MGTGEAEPSDPQLLRLELFQETKIFSKLSPILFLCIWKYVLYFCFGFMKFAHETTYTLNLLKLSCDICNILTYWFLALQILYFNKSLLRLLLHNILNQHWEGTLASPNMQQTRKIKNRNMECMVDPMGPYLSDPCWSWQTPSSHQLQHE